MRAEWRKRADDPKSALGWWWRDASRSSWPVYPLGLAVPVAVVLGHPWGAGAAMGALAVWGGILSVRAVDELAPLLPDPAPEGQFRASVRYRRNGLTTGRDEMALTVVDGWLVGEGVRSNFALRPHEVRSIPVGFFRGVGLALQDGSEIHLSRLEDDAYTALTRWRWPRSSPEGESTLPPARAHPQELARWGASSFGGVVILGVGGLIAPLLLPDHLVYLCALGAFGGGMIAAYATKASDRLNRLAQTEVLPNQDSPSQEESVAERVVAKRR